SEYTRSLCESNRCRKASESPCWQAARSAASLGASVTARATPAGASFRVSSKTILAPLAAYSSPNSPELVAPAHPFLPSFSKLANSDDVTGHAARRYRFMVQADASHDLRANNHPLGGWLHAKDPSCVLEAHLTTLRARDAVGLERTCYNAFQTQSASDCFAGGPRR